MDIEFHYYILFILCRKAEFTAEDSFTVAYSSQYTDDNNFRYYVNFGDGSFYLNEISQTMDITKPSPKRQKIYPLFHFIPGGEASAHKNQFKRRPYHEFTTVADSSNAQTLMKAAILSKDLYQIGIATHAYADTWAHQNFLGFEHAANANTGLGKLIPNIGHADFLHEPDKVHNTWRDGRLKREYAEIDNDRRFLEAARAIFDHLWRFKHPGDEKRKALKKYDDLDLEFQLKDAMDETFLFGPDERSRIKAYKKISNELGEDRYKYDANEWRYDAVEKAEVETDIFDRYWAKDKFYDSPWYRFQEAVKAHRKRALNRFRPLYEKAGLQI